MGKIENTKKIRTPYSIKKYVNAIVISDSSKIKISYRKWIKPLMYFYAFLILFFVANSLFLSAFVENKIFGFVIEISVFSSLTLDYVLRFWTCDIRIKKGKLSYFLFPLRLNSIMLLLSLLPSFYLVGINLKDTPFLSTLENMKFLRIFRLILLLNIFPSLRVLSKVLNKERNTLSIIFFSIIITILLFALAIYSIEEPNSIAFLKNNPGMTRATAEQEGYIFTYWQAIYYSTITLTTIGFGDFAPHTQMGQIVTTTMSILGVAIVAAPTGIIAGSFMGMTKEMNALKRSKNERMKSYLINTQAKDNKNK